MVILPITTYTSFSFGIVSVIAFHKRLWLLGTLWQMLYGVSVLNHSLYYNDYTLKKYVDIVDRTLAHTIIIISCHYAITQELYIISLFMYWICLSYMTHIYYIADLSHLPNGKGVKWHSQLHLAAFIGELFLFLGDVKK